jgi:hypothetical protein
MIGQRADLSPVALLRLQVPFVQPSSSFLSSAMEVPNAGLVYVSGVCGVDKGKFISGTVKDRTVQSIKRIEALLQEKGLDLTDGPSPVFLRDQEPSSLASALLLSRRLHHLPRQLRRGLCCLQ